MWSELTKVGGITNTVTMPTEGVLSIVKPEGTELCAYVNGAKAPLHHLHVNAGDTVYFELESHGSIPGVIEVQYGGETHNITVVPTVSAVETYDMSSLAYDEIVPISVLEPMEKQMTPAETINLFANPNSGASGMGAGAGAGLGAGLLGGVLGGALLGNNRNGLLGNNGEGNVGGVVTPALLAASLAQVTDVQNNSTILQSLGDIKASIPYAEGQVQLALAGSTADINGNITSSTLSNLNGQVAINKNISDSIATALAGQGAIKDSVLTAGATNLNAILINRYELTKEVRDDGDKTRALLIAQNDATLNRELSVAQTALAEQRAIGRSRDVEVNVSQNVNQNQTQLQQQQQQQQQFLITNNLLQAILSQAQVAQATNQSLIIGNTGAVHGGNQTANPVNVRA
jgi:hypothetical protein